MLGPAFCSHRKAVSLPSANAGAPWSRPRVFEILEASLALGTAGGARSFATVTIHEAGREGREQRDGSGEPRKAFRAFRPRRVSVAPTFPLRSLQTKWSAAKADRNLNEARVQSSALELESLQSTGRVMFNERWLPCEAPLSESEGVLHTVTEPSVEQGAPRRDPRSTPFSPSRQATTFDCGHGRGYGQPRSASAMGSYVDTSSRSRGRDGTSTHPVAFMTSGAPFDASAATRLAIVSQRSQRSQRSRRSQRSQTPATRDGHIFGDLDSSRPCSSVDHRASSAFWAPKAIVGDGCPGVVTMNKAARSSQRGIG